MQRDYAPRLAGGLKEASLCVLLLLLLPTASLAQEGATLSGGALDATNGAHFCSSLPVPISASHLRF